MKDINKVITDFIIENLDKPIDDIIRRNLNEATKRLQLDLMMQFERMLDKKLQEIRKSFTNSNTTILNLSDDGFDYLDRDQTLKFLNISNATLTKYVKQKELTPYNKGKKHFFKKTELELFKKKLDKNFMDLIYSL